MYIACTYAKDKIKITENPTINNFLLESLNNMYIYTFYLHFQMIKIHFKIIYNLS